MTHHAVLGKLTATKHGLTDQEYVDKWGNLAEFEKHPQSYSRVQRAVLEFARAFCTNPKIYSDAQYNELRAALGEDNRRRFAEEGLWLQKLNVARAAHAEALLKGLSPEEDSEFSRKEADQSSDTMPDDLNDRKVNAQVVELAFLCLQFVALTGMFTGLNIPDEDFLADVMSSTVPPQVIGRINALNRLGANGMEELVPPKVVPPIGAIIKGMVNVEPAAKKGARIPLLSYEVSTDLDKGVTVGGVQVGVYGWSFGLHFPGGLVYCLMHHPELARYEPPYSLPVLFNEDEWRNGVNTSGFVTRRLKEIIIQGIYKILRSRYGIEHHTMFFYNSFLDEYGVNRPPKPILTPRQAEKARKLALARADDACMWIHDYRIAPSGVFTSLETAALAWTEMLLRRPHEAHTLEGALRKELDLSNRREIEAGFRRLDTSSSSSNEDALQTLVHHQIAELAMMIGHMDGLGRVLTILRLESEEPRQMIGGRPGPAGSIIPDLDSQGQVKFTGYYNNRPGLLQILRAVGVSEKTFTVNELMVNPELNGNVISELAQGKEAIRVTSETSAKTGEF